MNFIYTDIRLDMCRTGFGGCTPVFAKQGDYNSRALRVTMQDRGKRLVIDENAEIVMNVKRPDGAVAVLSGSVDEQGRAVVPLKLSALEKAGRAECDISVINDGFKLTTVRLIVIIEAAAVDNSDVLADGAVDLLRALIIRAERNNTVLCESIEQAKECERELEEKGKAAIDEIVTELRQYEAELIDLIAKGGAMVSYAMGVFKITEHNSLAVRFDEAFLYAVTADSYRLFDAETDIAIGDMTDIGGAMYLPKIIADTPMRIRYYRNGGEICGGLLEIKKRSEEPYMLCGEIR